MITNFEELQNFIKENKLWTDEKFPGQSIKGIFIHLRKEVNELIEELDHAETFGSEGPALTEVADVFLLFTNGTNRLGFTFQQILTASENKMKINRKRTWIKHDDGHYQHTKVIETMPGTCYTMGGTANCFYPACHCKRQTPCNEMATISNQDPAMQEAMKGLHKEITGIWIDEIEQLRKKKLWDKHGPLAARSPWWKRITTVTDCEAHTRAVQFEWTPKFCWYTPAIEINLDMREVSVYILCFAVYFSWGNRAKRRQLFDNSSRNNFS